MSRPPRRLRRSGAAVRQAAGRINQHPRIEGTAKQERELLFGTSGVRTTDPRTRRLAELIEGRPGVMRELGLSTFQVWQAVSERRGRGRGDRDLAIVFTDLVQFSSWALEAGDEAALELLENVRRASDVAVKEHHGQVVKWLGDGMMAVFADPAEALDARERVAAVEVEGYDPQLRAGVHLGRPRKVRDDYFGADVTLAARAAEEAVTGELMASGRLLEEVDCSSLHLGERRLLQVKGVPEDVEVFAVARTDA